MDWPQREARKGARQPDLRRRPRRLHREISRSLCPLARRRLERDRLRLARPGRVGAGRASAIESFDPLIDDLAALLADWRAATPGPHVAIGHSMGGHLLLRALVERRPALDAAVLVAPMIGVNSAPIPAWLAPAIANAMCRLGLGAGADVEDAAGDAAAGRRSGSATSPARASAMRTRPGGGSASRAGTWARRAGPGCAPPSARAAAAFTPRGWRGVDLPMLLVGAEPRPAGQRRGDRAGGARCCPHAELETFAGRRARNFARGRSGPARRARPDRRLPRRGTRR